MAKLQATVIASGADFSTYDRELGTRVPSGSTRRELKDPSDGPKWLSKLFGRSLNGCPFGNNDGTGK